MAMPTVGARPCAAQIANKNAAAATATVEGHWRGEDFPGRVFKQWRTWPMF